MRGADVTQQSLITVESDKASMEIPSSAAGVVAKMLVKVGDKVLYGKYSGTEVTIDGEQYLILRESDVLAVIS